MCSVTEERFQAGGKEISLYISDKRDCPLIVLNTFEGGGAPVLEEARKLGGSDFSLLSVGGLDWNRDMSPWECAPVMAQDEGYAGGADAYLSLLLEEILPEGLKRLPESPSWTGIAGYSLAGLFALYALYRTDIFARAASMSGSLWFPSFTDFVRSARKWQKYNREKQGAYSGKSQNNAYYGGTIFRRDHYSFSYAIRSISCKRG